MVRVGKQDGRSQRLQVIGRDGLHRALGGDWQEGGSIDRAVGSVQHTRSGGAVGGMYLESTGHRARPALLGNGGCAPNESLRVYGRRSDVRRVDIAGRQASAGVLTLSLLFNAM